MKSLSLFLLLAASTGADAWAVYQLHEWGTFTTVSGSDGKLLGGLEREEESLPNFVHSHLGMENGGRIDMSEAMRIEQVYGTRGFRRLGSKGVGRRPLKNVTVKMETPVIYFHSDEVMPFPVQLRVGFAGGTISQWYPQRSGGEKLPEPRPPKSPLLYRTPMLAWTIDFAKPYRGDIRWDVEVLTRKQTRETVLFKPGDDLGWLRTRQPMTNAVRTKDGETEGFLFYRGVGNFDTGLVTKVDAGETLHVSNNTGGSIPYLLVFERLWDGTVRWSESTAGLESGGEMSLKAAEMKPDDAAAGMPVYVAMKAGLMKQGLTPEEAASMVETWWTSYFSKPGLRVFWVLPRAMTDRILPMEVSPPPLEMVRVIVGRAEVLRPSQEAAWLAASKKTGDDAYEWIATKEDRFGLALQQRVNALADEEKAKEQAKEQAMK